MYGNAGIPAQFLWYAPQVNLHISPGDANDRWSACVYAYYPGTQCSPGSLSDFMYGSVTGDLTNSTLTVLKWSKTWVALACGNFHPDAGSTTTSPVPKIRVTKYLDLNRNGVQDAGEGPGAGFTFRLERDANGSTVDTSANPNIATATTNAQGTVTFPITVPPGRYYVEELPRDGWTLTAGQQARQPVDVGFGVGNKVYTVSFGNAPSIVATKTATAGFTRTYAWQINKQVDKTLWKQVGGTGQFNYTVNASHDAGTDSDWHVAGTISVTNYDNFAHVGVTVSDNLDTNANCHVDGGANATLPASSTTNFNYRCSYATPPPEPSTHTNMAVISWPAIFGNGPTATGAVVQYIFPADPTTLVDNCVDVTDTLDGTPTALGSTCVGGANDVNGTTTFTYSRDIPMPDYGCVDHTNTATFTTNTSGTQGSASTTVTTCGPLYTGALTIGYWRNKNGQAIIQAAGPSVGTCSLTPWLEQYAPFHDVYSTASCNDVASYTTSTINNASAAGASMNAMLKAQMLATALDVYFSDPTLGGNQINAPSPIGDVAVDLTKVCADPLLCSAYVDVTPAFGGAPGLTISQILSYAASQSSPGGDPWYGNDKPTQELAKDAFDAINNQVIFAYP